MRPLTLLLCALVLAAATAGAVALLTHGPKPPAVKAIELGKDAGTPRPAATSEFAPPRDDDDDDGGEDPDDPFDDDGD
jgi:hypothetical protein